MRKLTLEARERSREIGVARAKIWYQNNKQKKLEYDKAYRAANREKINNRYKVWRESNLADQKAKDVARRRANPEIYAASAIAWRKKNAEKLKAYEANRYRADAGRREQIRQLSLEWKKAHPEERRTSVRNRRARLKAGGVLSKFIEKHLMVFQNGKCPVCKCDITKRFHLDHIVPVSKGGKNEDSNVQLLCPPCNQSKGGKMPEQFMQSRGMLL